MIKHRFLVILAAASLAFLAGCAKAPDDTAIANDVKARIFSDPDLKTTNVEVVVKDGTVTLTGDLPNADLQLRLFKLAQDAPGVTKVDDQIRVPAAETAEAQPPPAVQAPPPPTAPARAAKPAGPAPAGPPAAPAPAPDQKAAEQVRPPVQPQAPAAAQPVTVEVPVGTRFSVRMADAIDSSKNKTGELFLATLDEPVPLKGEIAIPRGTDIYIKLAAAKSAGKISGSSELELQLNKMEFQGKSYPLASNSYEEKGKSRTKETATRVGIGAGVGAAIGAIAGGGKGAAIGAAIGGGGATAVQIFTRGQQIKVPAETQLEFKLEAPVTVTYTPAPKSK